MTKYQLALVGAFVLGALMTTIPEYNFLDWEFHVLTAPYIILGAFTT